MSMLNPAPRRRAPLTTRQTEVLVFIRSHIEEFGCPPTRVEIAKSIGCASPNSAEDHLQAMQKKGYIQLFNKARGIKVL